MFSSALFCRRFHWNSIVSQSSGSIVSLQENGRVAVHDSTRAYSHVLGKNVYQHRTVRFKLKLESFQNNRFILVGILKADVVSGSRISYDWPGTYGWSLGDSGNMCKNSVVKYGGSWKNFSKQGDTFKLILDCDSGKLSLHLPTGQQYHIAIPIFESWRLHVKMFGANDKIRIVEVVQY